MSKEKTEMEKRILNEAQNDSLDSLGTASEKEKSKNKVLTMMTDLQHKHSQDSLNLTAAQQELSMLSIINQVMEEEYPSIPVTDWKQPMMRNIKDKIVERLRTFTETEDTD